MFLFFSLIFFVVLFFVCFTIPCFHYCSSILQFEIEVISPALLLCKTVLTILFFFLYSYEAKMCPFNFFEDLCCNLMGISSNLQFAFGNTAIFNILILLIHEDGTYTNLLMSSTISFFDVIKLLYSSFTALLYYLSFRGYCERCCFFHFFLSQLAIYLWEEYGFCGFILLLLDESVCQLAKFLGKQFKDICAYNYIIFKEKYFILSQSFSIILLVQLRF